MSAKRQRTGSESEATLKSASRDGHYGGGNPVVASNADAGKDRIVLDDRYGQDADRATALSPVAGGKKKYEQELAGCANRYVGKCVVITGGSKGIGEGCSRAFFEAGSNVVICARGVKEGEALAAEFNGLGQDNKAIFVRADVSKVADLENLVNKSVEAFGRIDCLINNAGWHPPPKTIDEFSVEDMQDLFQLNFISYFAACKFALPHLRKVKGNIINMSSLTGYFGQAKAPTYCSTKGAITSFSKGLAIDEAANGVRVNIVSPGNIWTPLWKSWSDGEPDPDAAKEAGDRVQVMARKGTIIETGRLCLSIASELTFTTGVDHIQSGGAELGYGMK